MYGGCSSGTTTIEYLQLDGAGAIFFDTSGYTNVNFLHNQTTSVPYNPSAYGATSSLFLSGNITNIDANFTIEYNTFGDANSCTAALSVDDGTCAGVITGNVGHLRNFTMKYNTFYHLGEGVHMEQVDYVPGAQPIGDCNNCDIEFNFFNQIVRIWMEIQIGVEDGGNPMITSNNVFMNPYQGGVPWSGMALSAPCCQSSGPTTHPTNTIPSNLIQNNLFINSLSTSFATPNGIEMSGSGTQATNNLIQGFFCTGVVWSTNSHSWAISNNTITGQMMASGSACYSFGGSQFTTSECTGCTAPIMAGNVTGSTSSAITSVAPTSISPAAGSYAFPLAVTLTDPGYTSGAIPLGNTGIWYTTDGSTPVPGSGTAKYLASGGSFILPSAATVKAVGMWGSANQPTSYPGGYGFVPSSVVSAAYSASGGVLTLTGITLGAPSTALIAGGAAEQGTLICHYSDSSSDDCTNTDAHGFGPGTFASSLASVATISSTALITPLVAGTTNLTATLGVLTSTLPISVSSGASPFLGNNQENFAGFTSANFFNSVYAISPPYATTVGNCHFFLPTGTITLGAHYDCLIITAPTATTEASALTCHATYTTTSTSAPNAFVSLPITGCGTIAASTPYWVATNTNDSSGPNFGFWNCGGSCGATAPTTYGTGTYSSYWVAINYGTYTGLPSSLSANTYQVSQYVDLMPTAPTLVSGYQDNTLSINKIVLGSGYQQHAYCVYSDGVIYPCDTTDARGNAVTAWTEDSGGVILAIGAVGSGSPGLITATGYGQTNTHCTLTGSVSCAEYTWTVTNQPATSSVIQGANLHGSNVN